MTDAEVKAWAEAMASDVPQYVPYLANRWVAEAYLALLAREAARTATFAAHDELLAHTTEIEEQLAAAESERDRLLAKEAARGEVTVRVAAELRHLYQQLLLPGSVELQSLAEGLLSPQIRKLEGLLIAPGPA